MGHRATAGVAVSAELAFVAGDLAQMRFAVSPMWQVGTSSRLPCSGGAHPVDRPWAGQVHPRVPAAGLDRGLLAELIPPTGHVPDFLNPPPPDPPRFPRGHYRGRYGKQGRERVHSPSFDSSDGHGSRSHRSSAGVGASNSARPSSMPS